MYRKALLLMFLIEVQFGALSRLLAQEPRLGIPDSMLRYGTVVTVEQGDTVYDIALPQV